MNVLNLTDAEYEQMRDAARIVFGVDIDSCKVIPAQRSEVIVPIAPPPPRFEFSKDGELERLPKNVEFRQVRICLDRQITPTIRAGYDPVFNVLAIMRV